MLWSMVLAAAKPWTYWFAPVFLVATLIMLLVMAVAYYRRVLLPAFWYRVATEEARAAQRAARPRTEMPNRQTTRTPVPKREAA
jgi:hypothetical protein